MMTYAKLINDHPVYAPNPIRLNGYWIGNPPFTILTDLGYKPVHFTPYPEPLSDTGYYIYSWTEDEQCITQVWSWYEPPISSPN